MLQRHPYHHSVLMILVVVQALLDELKTNWSFAAASYSCSCSCSQHLLGQNQNQTSNGSAPLPISPWIL
jgi:hypothetical protein